MYPTVPGEGYWYAQGPNWWIQFLLQHRTAGTGLFWKVMTFNKHSANILFYFSKLQFVLKCLTLAALCSPDCAEGHSCAPWCDSTAGWSICCFTVCCGRRCTSSRRQTLVGWRAGTQRLLYCIGMHKNPRSTHGVHLIIPCSFSSPRQSFFSPALRRGPDGSHGGPERQRHGPQRGQNLPRAVFNAKLVLGAHCHDPHRDAAHRHHTEQTHKFVKCKCDNFWMFLKTKCKK